MGVWLTLGAADLDTPARKACRTSRPWPRCLRAAGRARDRAGSRRCRARGRTSCIERGRASAKPAGPRYVAPCEGVTGLPQRAPAWPVEARHPRYATRWLSHHALLGPARSHPPHRRGRGQDEAVERHAQLRGARRDAREQPHPRAPPRTRVGGPVSSSRSHLAERCSQRAGLCPRQPPEAWRMRRRLARPVLLGAVVHRLVPRARAASGESPGSARDHVGPSQGLEPLGGGPIRLGEVPRALR
jgi:hypothetical protein